MMPNQPIVRFQSIVLQPHRMQFVIDELPAITVCAAGWIYGGMEERPFTAFAVSVAVLFSLVLLYRFIYLRRTAANREMPRNAPCGQRAFCPERC